MSRFFNTAGPCRPDKHYMLSPEVRLPEVRRLVEREQYFVLHAPRQSGKTTTVRSLVEELGRSGEVAAVMARRGGIVVPIPSPRDWTSFPAISNDWDSIPGPWCSSMRVPPPHPWSRVRAWRRSEHRGRRIQILRL